MFGTSNMHLPVAKSDNNSQPVRRLGFTGHEQDFEQGLINMKGRIYDPRAARFLTADPMVQSPFNRLSLNRYAYVRNNPLKYIDPSGFETDQAADPDDFGPDDFEIGPNGNWQLRGTGTIATRMNPPGGGSLPSGPPPTAGGGSVAGGTTSGGELGPEQGGGGGTPTGGGEPEGHPEGLPNPEPQTGGNSGTGTTRTNAGGNWTPTLIDILPLAGPGYHAVQAIKNGNYGWAAVNVVFFGMDVATFGGGAFVRGAAMSLGRSLLRAEARDVGLRVVESMATRAVRTGLDDLGRFRAELGMNPGEGTLARLDVSGRSFYGISAHGQPVNLNVNAISRTHAEADAFQQAANAGVRGGRGTLFVDRDLCTACGTNGGVRGLVRQLGLEELEVITPHGTQIIRP
jgi:RHS repeat-associated protein